MRYPIGILTICLLAGCAGSPPKPPAVQGEYRPINKVESKETIDRQSSAFYTFDFNYEGDIINSLTALHNIQPQLNVLPPLGKVSPLQVRMNLRRTTLENALRTIGEQGGDTAEVVWNATQNQGGNQVFIRFRAPHQQPGEMSSANTN